MSRVLAKPYWLLVEITLLLCVALLWQTHAEAAAQSRVVGPRVVGTLMLKADGYQNGGIELPDAKMTLREAPSGQEVASTTTQLDGKFHLQAPKSGIYQVCWDVPGIVKGCGRRIKVGTTPVFLRTVAVSSEGGVITGKVVTGDDRPCWVNDPFFKLDVSTQIGVIDRHGNPAGNKVRANVFGEYAVGRFKAGRYVVYAQCEGAKAEAKILVGKAGGRANLKFKNRAPRLAAASVFDANKGAVRAVPNTQVQARATARDPDQDPIEYLWRTLDGYGTISGANTATQDWKLPAQAGRYSLYVMARDGKGGYAYKRIDMQVGSLDVSFSGRVIDETTSAPIAGASVTVNGVSTATNTQGWFNVTVPPARSPERYALNVNHPSYALLSRIHDKSGSGNTYEMTRAQTTQHDPAQPINITDNDSAGPCGSPGGREPPKVKYPASANVSDARQPRAHKATSERCRHRGAQLVLPAGALVGADNKLAQGPVRLAMATLNPARRSLPGDYRALDSGNTPTELLSFGAVYADFRDANGKPLNLKSGTAAEVRIPVSNLQRPSAKPAIDMWSYDEKSGMWVQEGVAQLQNTPQGWMYVGKTKHFSTINMDVAGNDPALATCVRLELDPSLNAWQNLVLRAYVSYNGTSVQVKETALDGATYHAIYRIPYGNAFPPNTLRLELRGTFNGRQVVLLDNLINTDARPKMTGIDLWPPYPYEACGVPIKLVADPIALPAYGDIDATGRPAFLTGPFGAFLPLDGEQVATGYYNAIAGNTKTTLGDWWSQNGFGATNGSGGTQAGYLNNNDLGFGRDMHCLNNGLDLACYVTNYGGPDQNSGNADLIAAQRGATVTMEYKASEPDAAKRVQFYVYGGGVAGSPRIKFADLDGMGPKPVPHLCLVCHGGSYDTASNKAAGARFREFDLPSFKYAGGQSWDFGQAAPSNLNLTAFATLNQKVQAITPAGVPIHNLISAWYPGGFGANTAPIKPANSALPTGWSTQPTIYHDVYGKSCRTCHVAQDESGITFNSSSSFQGTNNVVCGSPKVMPNAFVTYKNFWIDSSRVQLYKTFTGAATCQ